MKTKRRTITKPKEFRAKKIKKIKVETFLMYLQVQKIRDKRFMQLFNMKSVHRGLREKFVEKIYPVLKKIKLTKKKGGRENNEEVF